jgi:hypothetical protein
VRFCPLRILYWVPLCVCTNHGRTLLFLECLIGDLGTPPAMAPPCGEVDIGIDGSPASAGGRVRYWIAM